MPSIPNPVIIVTDNLQRAGRIRPGPQHLVTGAILAEGLIRNDLRKPGVGSGGMAKALGPSLNPPKLEIHDLSAEGEGPSGEGSTFIRVQFNPDHFTEKLEAHYDEAAPIGLSHERSFFNHSKSIPFEFEIYYDALEAVPSDDNPGKMKARGPKDLLLARKFIAHFFNPRPSTTFQAEPPRVMLIWPNFITVKGTFRTAEYSYERFASDGTLQRFTCKLTMKEGLEVRKTSDDVLRETKR